MSLQVMTHQSLSYVLNQETSQGCPNRSSVGPPIPYSGPGPVLPRCPWLLGLGLAAAGRRGLAARAGAGKAAVEAARPGRSPLGKSACIVKQYKYMNINTGVDLWCNHIYFRCIITHTYIYIYIYSIHIYIYVLASSRLYTLKGSVTSSIASQMYMMSSQSTLTIRLQT